MPQSKTNNIQTRLRLSQQNYRWLEEMESRGVDRNALVNIALDMLQPRLENIGTSTEAIIKTTSVFDTTEY